MNETQEQLEKNIKFANYRLQQLSKHGLVSGEVNRAFNRLLIDKAVMVKTLKNMKVNRFKAFIAKLLRKIRHETLICDRF